MYKPYFLSTNIHASKRAKIQAFYKQPPTLRVRLLLINCFEPMSTLSLLRPLKQFHSVQPHVVFVVVKLPVTDKDGKFHKKFSRENFFELFQ